LRYGQDFIEQVRDANNIVDIIGQYTELKGKGGHQFMGLCPFPDHNEKSPSFSVSDSKQLYHCFGCKKSGNLFTFLETHQGMSFTDSVEFLARRAGIPLPEVSEEAKTNAQTKTTLYRINKFAAAFYHRQLKDLKPDHPVRRYVLARGIDEATIDEMKLGYAANEWSMLADFFASKKVPLKEAQQLGLIKPKKQNGYFDIFRHRLMFPILSAQEEVVGFGGRVLDKDLFFFFLNSPESPVFHKGKTFYGLNFAAKHIRQKDRVVIVEGYMDWIALYKAGIQNVVATLGTALTEDHARLIQKYTSQVVLMFDGDFAGQQAAERSWDPMVMQGLCPLTVFLPGDMDPDDYIKQNGPEDLQKKIDEAPELFTHLVNGLLKDFKFSSSEKMIFMGKMAPLLNVIADRGLQDLYIKEIAKRLSVEDKWVIREMKEDKPRALVAKARQATEDAGGEAAIEDVFAKVPIKGAPKEEVYLLSIGVNSRELLDKIIESGVSEEMLHGGVQKLLSLVIERYRQNPNDFDKLAPLVVSQVTDPEELTGLFRFWSLDGANEEALRVTLNCAKRVKERFLKRQSEIIAGQLQNSGSGESLEKLEQIMNIQKNRIQLNRPVKGEP